jgi:hypothetical protein
LTQLDGTILSPVGSGDGSGDWDGDGFSDFAEYNGGVSSSDPTDPVSVPGDVDGDGAPDVYASDFANAAHGPSTGRIVVHSGRTGTALLTLTGETAGEGFGTSPSIAGDVDGDGHADLIVGAWQYGGAAISGGRAYLYSGADGRLLRTFTCRIPGDTFGFDAVTLGDVDADGTIDLLITSAWSGVRGYHSGRVFVLSSGVRKPAPARPADQR